MTNLEWTLDEDGVGGYSVPTGGGALPDGAVPVFPFANAGAADDSKGSDGDLAILLDSKTFIQKENGTWQS